MPEPLRAVIAFRAIIPHGSWSFSPVLNRAQSVPCPPPAPRLLQGSCGVREAAAGSELPGPLRPASSLSYAVSIATGPAVTASPRRRRARHGLRHLIADANVPSQVRVFPKAFRNPESRVPRQGVGRTWFRGFASYTGYFSTPQNALLFFFFFSMIPTECEKGDPWNYPGVASDPRGPKASFRVRPRCAPSAELSPSPGPPPDAEVGTPVFGSLYVRRHRLWLRNLYRELSPSALFRA